MNWEAKHFDCAGFGEKDSDVEADEFDIGWERNGLHSHDIYAKGGIFEGFSGRSFIEAYEHKKAGG